MTRQNKIFLFVTGAIIAAVVMPQRSVAQQKSPSITPAMPLKDGWEEIDQRLVFLMIRLANVETSLDAVEKTLGITTRQVNSSVADAKRAEQGNERMDRQGGGPLKWSEFYGRTAEKFFYHPVDQSTTYHTATILSQQQSMPQQKPGAVPGYEGVPLSQRPPQFDYIYRANEEAKGRAQKEAAEFRNKRDQLLARRKSLEEEQSALWCEIAFRAVSHYDLDRKPLYRFEPILAADADAITKQHMETLKAAVTFLTQSLTIVSDAQKDQARAFRTVQSVVSNGRAKLDDVWLRQGIDTSQRQTPEARIDALAKRLDDVANNLSDSYKVSVDGERFKDELRKNTFRGLLQDSLVKYAEIVLALDEMTSAMAIQWKFKPDIDKPLAVSGNMNSGPSTSSAAASGSPVEANVLDLLSQVQLPTDVVNGIWKKSNLGLESDSDGRATLQLPYFVQGEYDFRITFTRISGNDAIHQVLSARGRNFSWVMGGKRNTSCGFELVDGKANNQNTSTYRFGLVNGQKYTALVKVRKDSVSAYLDGTLVSELKTADVNLSPLTPWLRGLRPDKLGLGTSNSPTIFHSVEVIPVK